MKRTIAIGAQRYEITSDDNYLAQMPEQFEPDMVALFDKLVEPGAVVADIGANIGITALLFAQRARQVLAFEPGPTTFALLQGNIDAAKARNVVPVNLGMGSETGAQTITFARSNRSGGFVSQHVQPKAGHVTETIRIETLDGFFWNRDDRPDFVKMDVEGFEPEVIKGGRTLLLAHKPTVVLELNHFCLNVLQRVTLPGFFDLLRSVFPVLMAVDSQNRHFADLHVPDVAYSVMHAHATRFAYPNIVAGFDPGLAAHLAPLSKGA